MEWNSEERGTSRKRHQSRLKEQVHVLKTRGHGQRAYECLERLSGTPERMEIDESHGAITLTETKLL